MTVHTVLPDLHQIELGRVNAFLLRGQDGLILIDAGFPGDDAPILDAIHEIGHTPTDVRHILLTHAHVDHTGGLAALKEETGAVTWMHPRDAELVRAGQAVRPYSVTPGLLNRLLYWVFVRGNPTTIAPAPIDRDVPGNNEIPVAGGLRAIHVPGHSAGHLAFLWPEHGGVLFAGDVAANAMGLGLSIIHEDLGEARRSLRKLSRYAFDVAVFGHGGPIRQRAAERFRETFGETG